MRLSIYKKKQNIEYGVYPAEFHSRQFLVTWGTWSIPSNIKYYKKEIVIISEVGKNKPVVGLNCQFFNYEKAHIFETLDEAIIFRKRMISLYKLTVTYIFK